MLRYALSHIDMTITDPRQSILFYAACFEPLGYRRMRVDLPEFTGDRPERAVLESLNE